MAGLNAARRTQGLDAWTPRRDEAYMGVLVDDLITNGTKEPYRMFTSRAEYRLMLREDNADQRLTEKGRELGLVDDARWQVYSDKMQAVESETARLRGLWATPNNALGKAFIENNPNEVLTKEVNSLDLLKRPNISFADIAKLTDSPVTPEVGEQIEIGVKYAGYIDRQAVEIGQMQKLEHTAIPDDMDYRGISGLSNEIVQKLDKVRPATLAQASRISGVTPAAVQLLAMTIKKLKKTRDVSA